MKLLGVVILAVLLLACAGMSEARMPKVGDQVSIDVYSWRYWGTITDMDDTTIALDCILISRLNVMGSPYEPATEGSEENPIQVVIGKGAIQQLKWMPWKSN